MAMVKIEEDIDNNCYFRDEAGRHRLETNNIKVPEYIINNDMNLENI